MKKVYTDVAFDLSSDKPTASYGESFTITLKASGIGAKPGLKIPYRILNGPSPYGSDNLIIDFTYDRDIDYYYLHVILTNPLGADELEVTQLNGPNVNLEKISDTLYKYPNPLDRIETYRTFRATLKAYTSDGDMVQGVRAFDFTYSNEYGYFELDSNLQSKKTFKNKISLLTPIDRLFNISLYYMPQYFTNVLFGNNYTPPTPYPEIVNYNRPKIKIEPVASSIIEGEDAVFKVSYENIRINYNLVYKYLDTKDNFSQEDFFTTNNLMYNYVRIPTTKLEEGVSRTRYVSLTIKDYPKITSLIYVNKAE